MSRARVRSAAAAAALALLTACGSSATLPAVQQRASQPSGAKQTVTITVAVPARPTQQHARRPAYVSAGTASMAVTVAPDGGTTAPPLIVNCARLCSASVGVAPGNVTITVALYDDLFGRGNLLSRGTTTTTIVANVANTVKLTFDPVVQFFGFGNFVGSSLPFASALVIGQPATISNVFLAGDADGYVIVGPGAYTDANGAPVTFTFTNAGSGHTSLGVTSASAPGAVPLSYDGHGVVGTIAVSSSLGQTSYRYVSTLAPEQEDLTNAMWPQALALGADGNVWFVLTGVAKIFRRNGDGSISAFPLVVPSSGGSIGRALVLAGDNALWVPFGNLYERVTAAGSVTTYPIPTPLSYYSIDTATRDASGKIVFATLDGKLASIANDGTVTQLTVPNASGFGFGSLLLGSDHRVWFLDHDAYGGTTLVAYDGTTFTRYPTGSPAVQRIFAGPDGTLWVPWATANSLVKFDTAGNRSSVALPAPAWSSFGGSPDVAAAALDGKGNFYFADSGQSGIGRIDASLHAVEYPVSAGSLYPVAIVVGSDGKLYYGDSGQTGVNGPQFGGLGSVDPALF
ncbi:MAG: hypothetical protein JO036_02795 [Candidatus Eremiobacteraeota bacterium]|nr:hypothetical protein [Candidatus Eremiobacteraeota bacterium]